jgi:hypothetical protein
MNNDDGMSYQKWCLQANVNPLFLTTQQRIEVIKAWQQCEDPETTKFNWS